MRLIQQFQGPDGVEDFLNVRDQGAGVLGRRNQVEQLRIGQEEEALEMVALLVQEIVQGFLHDIEISVVLLQLVEILASDVLFSPEAELLVVAHAAHDVFPDGFGLAKQVGFFLETHLGCIDIENRF